MQLENKYLGGFLQDATENINEASEAVKADSLWLAGARSSLLAVRDSKISLDSATALIKKILNISKLDIQSGTYKAIINSGNLHIINSYSMKKEIVDYHETVAGVEFIDNYFYKYFSEFVTPFLFSEYNILNGKLKNPAVIKSTRFSNVIAWYYSMVQQRRKSYSNFLKKSIALRNNLKKII